MKIGTFAVEARLFFDRFIETIPKVSKPFGLQFHLQVPIHIVQDLLNILNGIINSLLFLYNFLLPTGPHQTSLFNHLHNFLLLFRLYLLLLIIILQIELTRISLDLKINRLLLFVVLIGVVVILNHQVDITIQVAHQFVTIIQIQTNEQYPVFCSQ